MSRKSTTKKRRRRGILSSLFCCFGSRSHNLSQDIKSNGSPLTNHETQPSISRAEEKENKVRLWDNLSSLQFTFRFEFNNFRPGALNHICVSFQLHAHFKFPPQTTRFSHDLLHGTIKRIQCNRDFKAFSRPQARRHRQGRNYQHNINVNLCESCSTKTSVCDEDALIVMGI